MSFFSKVFGGKKEAAAPSTAEAIQKLRETEDMLIKKQEFLESKIDHEVLTAKKNASKNKRGIGIYFYNRLSSRTLVIVSSSLSFHLRFDTLDYYNPSFCTLLRSAHLYHTYIYNFYRQYLLTLTIVLHTILLNIKDILLLAAIQALKRKKRYEKQLQQIDGTLSTIEMQREALESANTNTAVLTTMKGAADAMKAAHQHM